MGPEMLPSCSRCFRSLISAREAFCIDSCKSSKFIRFKFTLRLVLHNYCSTKRRRAEFAVIGYSVADDTGLQYITDTLPVRVSDATTSQSLKTLTGVLSPVLLQSPNPQINSEQRRITQVYVHDSSCGLRWLKPFSEIDEHNPVLLRGGDSKPHRALLSAHTYRETGHWSLDSCDLGGGYSDRYLPTVNESDLITYRVSGLPLPALT
ncbi:hypothetical protein F2P81_004171 [Scophthalmus maximus]|uniref:Uncharacterized protein n=1 Tax=Scophthalmus maximus TaxID=52904 RepID=A0A6A4THX4_SCOMX|nr:hypothetical protein F2P81_004171 [Scophthalmus maximus]